MFEPYRFEPKSVHVVADDDSSENNETNVRSNSTFWSFWGPCQRGEAMFLLRVHSVVLASGIGKQGGRYLHSSWHYVIVIVFSF